MSVEIFKRNREKKRERKLVFSRIEAKAKYHKIKVKITAEECLL